MKCSNCGNEIKEGAKFCTKCGTKVETVYYCAECGTKLEADEIFCPECGTKRDGIMTAGKPSSSSGKGNVSVGDTITLGSYWQGRKQEMGKTPIEWRVLEKKEDGSLLVISKYGLESRPYNEDREDVTWSSCTLRRWLNSNFFNDAFSTEEKNKIKEITIENPDNEKTGTVGGDNTSDKVFLLSIGEAEKLFGDKKDRNCQPSEYAISQNSGVLDDYGNCGWWLRSPGLEQIYASEVSFGEVDSNGGNITNAEAIRPALILNL